MIEEEGSNYDYYDGKFWSKTSILIGDDGNGDGGDSGKYTKDVMMIVHSVCVCVCVYIYTCICVCVCVCMCVCSVSIQCSSE